MSRIMNSDMVGTSQLVKRIDDCIAGRGSQVDINSRTVDGMVAEIRSQGKKIHAVLIAVYRLRSAEDLWDIGWEDYLDRGVSAPWSGAKTFRRPWRGP